MSKKFIDYAWGFDGMTPSTMRQKMQAGWKVGGATVCGSGSTMDASTASRNSIKEFWHKVEKPKRIANIGAGETHWWINGNLPKAHHYDLIPRSSDVIEFDCTVDVLPQEYDIVVMRWVLNHLSARLAFEALRRICPKTRYIIMTHKPEGKQTEYWAEHGLELPEPIAMNDDWEKWKLALFRAADIYNRLPDPLPA